LGLLGRAGKDGFVSSLGLGVPWQEEIFSSGDGSGEKFPGFGENNLCPPWV